MARLLWIAEGAPASALRDALLDQGDVLLCAEPAERSFASAARLAPDALLLQGSAATGAMRRLRGQLPQSVMVVLVPGLTLLDEVLLLGMGADLVVDPTQGTLVLLARLRRWLQRSVDSLPPTATRRDGPFAVEAESIVVRVGGRALALGRHAGALLQTLAARNGAAASRAELSRCLRAGSEGCSRRVDTAIWRLRHALQSQGVCDIGIESVRGEGYRLVWRQPETA